MKAKNKKLLQIFFGVIVFLVILSMILSLLIPLF